MKKQPNMFRIQQKVCRACTPCDTHRYTTVLAKFPAHPRVSFSFLRVLWETKETNKWMGTTYVTSLTRHPFGVYSLMEKLIRVIATV
jgi:hypothetical protein